MSIAIDVILLAILLSGIIIGVKKGFVRSVMSFVTFIASFICAWQFTPLLAEYYHDSYLMEKASKMVSEAISKIIGSGIGSLNVGSLISEQPTAFTDIIDRYSTDIGALERYYYAQQTLDTSEVQRNVSEFIAGPAADALSTGLAFLTIFIGVTIVLSLAAAVLDLIFKLPGLSTLNRVLGFMLGAVCGLLYTWAAALILTAIVPALAALYPEVISPSMFENSILLNIFNEYNPLRFIGIGL